jgi:amino acid transporter
MERSAAARTPPTSVGIVCRRKSDASRTIGAIESGNSDAVSRLDSESNLRGNADAGRFRLWNIALPSAHEFSETHLPTADDPKTHSEQPPRGIVMALRELLFGQPLRTEEESAEQLGVWSGVPVLGLDALASASYGPEAALTVLLPLGTVAAANYIPIISLCILGVLFMTFLSYRQTIPTYPTGGGSFTVARENLGPLPGILAASALAIDYILNVAVAISAAVGALVSAVPDLLPDTLTLCLGILALLTIVNLRGVRTAGLIFMLPTYAFVGCLGVTITVGVAKIILTGGQPVPVAPPPLLGTSTNLATAWLFLRAFSSGCSALTGIEAVSNAVPIFRPPAVTHARRTLTAIVTILALLLTGIGVLAHYYRVGALPPGEAGYQSVVSQMVAAVMGRGLFYFVTMAAVLAVLALSANTSFADFPRVCRVLAQDEYLPAEFAHRGSRLVYSSGIVLLTASAALLLIVFHGVTDRLIPLFAVGAFLAFTLSQLGMVFHWRRSRAPHARRSLYLNAAGALATGATLLVIVVSKFAEGAWITVVVIPVLIGIFIRIRSYHQQLGRETDTGGPLDCTPLPSPVIVIPMKRMDRVTRKALRLAMSFTSEVRAVQILSDEIKAEDLSQVWDERVENPARAAGRKPPYLKVVHSPYREFYGPLITTLQELGHEYPDRTIAVMIPEMVERKWRQFVFRHRATLLKALLLLRGGPRIVLITTPWYFDDERTENVPAARGTAPVIASGDEV